MDKIEKIRQEIERRRLHFNKEAEKYQALNNGYSQNCYGARDALRDLENFLDTLSEEPDKSLEEEVKNYFQGYWPGTETAEQCNIDLHFTPPAIIRLARHFAEWQKEQDLKEAAQSRSPLSVAYANRCFENGKQAMKEQMLKDAVEGEVVKDISNKLTVTAKGINLDGFKFGQKVRIVVLKEEEE